MTARAKQIFEYLLAIKNLSSPPIRRIQDVETYLFIEDFPQGDGCYLFGTGKDPDAWLEVHKQTIIPPPEPHDSFRSWLSTNYEDETVLPQVLEQTKNNSQTEYFTDSMDRTRHYHTWLNAWKNWAEETRRRKAIQKLYIRLFTLEQQMKREGERFEVAFGHGILNWKHDKGTIYHPLFITRLEIDFQPQKGIFTLSPTSQGTIFETEMLAGLDLPNESFISDIRTSIEEIQPNPLSSEEIYLFYQKIIHSIHPKGQFISETSEVPSTEIPTILDRTVWFIRKKSSQIWKDELRTVIKALDNNLTIPKSIQSLIQVDVSPPDELEQKEWESIGKDLYFPLPANEEQKDIARRLAESYAVTVQGPPGTGKSHTIANLISHLLAHGKKVLVTSHKEPALRVLADKIPASIRSLCVSLLGRDSKSIQEIENAIRSISYEVDSINLRKLGEEIQRLEQELKETRKHIAQIRGKLQKIAEYDTQEINWDGEKLNPLETAQRLSKLQPSLGWIPDPIHSLPPLSDQEMRQLWKMLKEFPPNIEQISQQKLPDLILIDPPDSFSQWVQVGNQLKAQMEESHILLEKYNLPYKAEWLSQLEAKLDPVLYHQDILSTSHFQNILDDWIADGERQKIWIDLFIYVKNALEEISRIQNRVAEYDLNIPDIPKHQLVQDLNLIAERLKTHKRLSTFFLITSGRKLRYLLDFPVIEGRTIQSVEDVEILLHYVTLLEKKERLIRKWNTTLQSVKGPTLSISDPRYIATADHQLKYFEQVFSLGKQIQEIRENCLDVKLPLHFAWNRFESLQELKQAIQATKIHIQFQNWQRTDEAKQKQLRKWMENIHSHPLCQTLYQAYLNKDEKTWADAYEQVKKLQASLEQYDEWKSLIRKIENKAPLWAEQLCKKMGTAEPFPSNWKAAWDWRRVYTLIEKLNSLSPEKLEAKLQEEERRERRLIEQLVAKSAWREQITRITEPKRRSLMNWRYYIKKIGRGTGKFAHQYRQEAKKEMKVCQTTIPVWIMPIDRVIENISIYNEKFDVIIVDESSQSDIFALSALLRAKKAVIVGDDEQISPATVGIDHSEIHRLIERYLYDIPQANSLDLQTSLYDIAVRIFPSKLMLREHFRSVPEIIEFSNHLCYEGEIIPLRLSTQQERIDPPLLAIKVDGFRHETRKINEAEAEAIVHDMTQMVKDPAFQTHTIGVISLLGHEQAELIESKLRDTIGEEKILQHQIICGDAYTFQGNERDIIFLSMVVATNVRFQTLVRKDLKQRFNVAASRARNQMRLYHSVELTRLNPEDLRYRLLHHCQETKFKLQKIENPEELCESQFELDVYRLIRSKGFQVYPQVQIGRHRIDLIIEGTQNRLAVECIGDRWQGGKRWHEAIQRQQILERAGWTFWRIRGSSFYLNPEQTMEPLWKKLAEMGIERELEMVL
ncbi:AAA domain-containing protein [Thermoflavimicrobium daqui]|uniref:AAA+ ATPase domain-containing protein n=1 Tax=Thermoflavimicrobium daqui TaxID=2137476 RepID=A0A364K0T9_9BACL|nr:AAA domain-containing protein [Thermoflavimicrobium daqui]RAL21308.1 hypothetical protein DL897_16855 [Thermoflavimicrobium daqui]